MFCHHRATASELLNGLERLLKSDGPCPGPPEDVWREVWEKLLAPKAIWPDEGSRPAAVKHS